MKQGLDNRLSYFFREQKYLKEFKQGKDSTVGSTSSHFVELLPGEWPLHMLDILPGPARALLLDGILEKGLQGQQHTDYILGGEHADV